MFIGHRLPIENDYLRMYASAFSATVLPYHNPTCTSLFTTKKTGSTNNVGLYTKTSGGAVILLKNESQIAAFIDVNTTVMVMARVNID